MFGGINIDPQQMQQMAMNQQICASHPECKDCPLYTLQGYNGTICENAIVKLSQGGNANESGQSDTTQQGAQEAV